jgi:preprotein translocase subunit SecG
MHWILLFIILLPVAFYLENKFLLASIISFAALLIEVVLLLPQGKMRRLGNSFKLKNNIKSFSIIHEENESSHKQ